MHRSNTPSWSLAGDETGNAPSDLDYFSEIFSPFSPVGGSHLLPNHSGTADDFAERSGDLGKRSSGDPGKQLVPVEKSERARTRKRSRTSAMHNLTERRRRDKIKDKLKTLQSLVPNSSKLDRASLLEEAIVYIKALQQQLQIFSCCGASLPCSQLPCFSLFPVPCSAANAAISSSTPFPAASCMMPSATPSSISHFQQAPVAMNYWSSNASQSQDEMLQSVKQAECSYSHGKG